jgi:hypothetical protein
VAPGEATRRRLGVEVAARREQALSDGAWLQLDLGLSLSALSVDGQGFSQNTGAWLFDPGAVAGLRVAAAVGRVRPWVGVHGAYWPRVHRLSVTGPGAQELATLPAAEVLLGAGANFGVSR